MGHTKAIRLLKALVTLLFLLIAFTDAIAQKKKIYIANDDHTDYMWTGDEATYQKAFSEMLDYYIRLNDSTASLPYALQSKWNCDGSYWVYNYRKTRTPQQFEKLIAQIKKGQITVPLNSMIVLLGAAPAEATIRDMYYAGSLVRKYGLEIPLVLNMEDQVLPLGLSSLWAGAGAKYSWKGVCACASKVAGLDKRKNQMYWYRGLDGQQVLMKWYSINPVREVNRVNFRYSLGTYLEASIQEHAVIDCKALMNHPSYPYAISAAFGKGGDDLKTLTDSFPKIAKAHTDAGYEVIVSNEVDFFKDFEATYGTSLPAETVSYGSTEWGNSFASLAEVSASMKRALEKLRAAEALYTMVSLQDKNFAADLSEKKEEAWLACGMYYEHDWTADGPHITRKQRADWQRKTATRFTSYVDTLYNQSLKRLGQLIRKDNAGESFFVFNPLSWERSDYCDYSYKGSQAITVIDKTTGKAVPFQFIGKKDETFLRIYADKVPSLGYKVFQIKAGADKPLPATVLTTDSTIENKFYKLKITRQGVITSLIDKRTGKQYVKPFEKLYFNDLGSGLGDFGDSLVIENSGAVSTTVRTFSYKPIKHVSKFTLFRDHDRIEIENYIQQNLDAKPVTYSFSFDLSRPDTWHEEAGAVLKAKSLSRGGHYSDTMSRVDWLALNHFADVSDATSGMTLSNRDAYFFKTGKSGLTKLDDSSAHIKVLAAGQIDNALGILNQDGDAYFENYFALKPHDKESTPVDAMRFSLQHQNPLVAGRISGGRALHEKQYSMLTVSDPGVIAWALKPAEEGIKNGIILRVWNISDKEKEVSILPRLPLVKAFNTTHIETGDVEIPASASSIQTTLGHHRMQTFRLFLQAN